MIKEKQTRLGFVRTSSCSESTEASTETFLYFCLLVVVLRAVTHQRWVQLTELQR